MSHTHGAPDHPQTQGKITSRDISCGNTLPCDLEAHIAAFVGHYDHQRYHEGLKNLTPADVYTGRGHTILLQRETTKRRAMNLRRLQQAEFDLQEVE